jgi:hypothetical protein
MKHPLHILIITLALALSLHALAIAAAPMMPHAAEMAMDHTAMDMPSDCLAYCLANLNQMSITGIPAQAPQLMVVFAVLLTLIYTVLQIRTPRLGLQVFRPKPPDILSLGGAYLI